MAKKNNTKSIEETLWQSCDKLRGSVEPSEYKHVVLSLIFLKFASDKFEERREELIEEGKEKYVEMKEFYNMKNVFFLEEVSRWSFIVKNAKQNDIALKKEPSEIFNNALNLSEKINGLGVNILTEIMNTYNPKRCSVLNKNPLESLNEIGFQKFKSQQYFNSNDYQVFNKIMIDILNKCKFKNLGQVDHFCNYIYWKYVKHNKVNSADAKSHAAD